MKLIHCFPCLKSQETEEIESNETVISRGGSETVRLSKEENSKELFKKELVMFGWGSNDYGQLGCGTEQRFIKEPIVIEGRTKVVSIAAGLRHTLYLTAGNNVYSCGSNEYGQLGQSKSQSRPSSIEEFENINISQIYAGDYFSLALTEEGKLFGWGRSDHHELLSEEEMIPKPRIIQSLNHHKIVQVAAGSNHVIALDKSGSIIVWGDNTHGQLGLGPGSGQMIKIPSIMVAMRSLPISQIFSGSNHSGCLTHSGAIFVWGKNNFGQLGTGNSDSSQIPILLKTIRDQGVKYVDMGEDHSVALTYDGGVFSWGQGGHGQLGHGTISCQNTPRKVFELMGNRTISLACGRKHTLVLTSTRSVFGFGLNCNNQLGPSHENSIRLPQTIKFGHVESYGSPNSISAGGDQSFCGYDSRSELAELDCDKLSIPIFKMISFYQPRIGDACYQLKSSHSLTSDIKDILEEIFSSSSCLNSSFLADDHYKTSSKYHGLSISKCSSSIARIFNHKESLNTAMDSLLDFLIPSLPSIPPDIETLRAYIIIPICFHFADQYKWPKLRSCLVAFSKKFLSIKGGGEKVLKYWSGSLDTTYFQRMVEVYKRSIETLIEKITPLEYQKNEDLYHLASFLQRLYQINEVEGVLHFSKFYLKNLPKGGENLFEDYKIWSISGRKFSLGNFSFCLFPFVYDAQSKAALLRVESQITQYTNMNQAQQRNTQDIVSHLMTGGNPRLRMPHLILEVSRENIVHDTVQQIERIIYTESNGVGALRKPLLVSFRGEEARDANTASSAGVRREFFMLLLQNLLNPDYGMIKEDDESNLSWFRDSDDNSEITLRDFFLLGIICGLAIYNDNIVDLRFPLALYKKLLNVEPDVQDLEELHPSVGRSMKKVLESNEDDRVEDWGLYFSVDREEFGETTEIELVPGGKDIPVTFENRKEYVKTYIQYIFQRSCKEKFRKFEEGFNRIVDNPVYHMFRPEELQENVVGAVVIDWKKLEDRAKYHEGYSSAHPSIKTFWAAFHQMGEEEKKKFLVFLTGSSRVPIGGLEVNIKFVNVSPEHLPVAHTCFNLLDLPPYTSTKKTIAKLRQALATHSSGFQLV